VYVIRCVSEQLSRGHLQCVAYTIRTLVMYCVLIYNDTAVIVRMCLLLKKCVQSGREFFPFFSEVLLSVSAMLYTLHSLVSSLKHRARLEHEDGS